MFRGIFAPATAATDPTLTEEELRKKIEEHKAQWETAKNVIVQGGMLFWTSCLPGGLLINITSSVLSDMAKEPLLSLLTIYEPPNSELLPWAKDYYIDLNANQKLQKAIKDAKTERTLPSASDTERPLTTEQHTQLSKQLANLTGSDEIDVQKLLDHVRAQDYSLQEFSSKLAAILEWIKTNEKSALDDKALLGYMDFLTVLNTAANKLNCKPLQLVALGTKGIMAGQELVKRLVHFDEISAKAGSVAAVGITFGGVAALGNIFIGLLELFGNQGPNPLKIISDQIAQLSNQIKALSEQLQKQQNILFQMQKDTINIMVHGFTSLALLVQSNYVGQGIETNAKLADVQEVLNFTVRIDRLDKISAFNQQFETVFSRASLLLQHMLHDDSPQKIADDLVVCAASHAHNNVVTGVNLWEAVAPRFTLEDIFRFTMQGQGILLNYMIGFLGRRYGSSQELTNPYLWSRCVMFYLSLLGSIPSLREEISKEQLNKLQEIGERHLNLLTCISNDEAFWNRLF